MMSIKYDSQIGRGFDGRDGLAAGSGRQNAHAAALQHTAEGEDIAHVIIDDQDLLAHQRLVGAVQPVQHLLLLNGQVADHAVQEESGFVEQALGRFHILHDDAARQHVQARIFFRGEVFSREDDDRQFVSGV